MLSFHTFTIKRLSRPDDESGTSKKRSWQSTGVSISGHIQTASPEFAAMNDGEFGKVFQLYSDDLYTDLRIGDRIEESGIVYDVKGVMRHTDAPARKLEATLTLHIEQ